jgi:hypothetical protein
MRELTGRAARRLLINMGAALFGSFASSAVAQDALMPTPSGLTPGSYLVNTYPVLIPGDDDEVGFFVRGARGMTERLSVRASLGLYNDLTYLGATQTASPSTSSRGRIPRPGSVDAAIRPPLR